MRFTKLFFSFSCICILTIILFSCSKIDRQSFFNVQANKEEILQPSLNSPSFIGRIKTALSKQNEKHEFLSHLESNEGSAVWDKYLVYASKPSPSSRGTSDTVVILPLVVKNTKLVSSFLVCKIQSDTVLIKLIRGRQYRLFGYSKRKDSMTANSVASQLMYLQAHVFGDTTFLIRDSKLFNYEKTPGIVVRPKYVTIRALKGQNAQDRMVSITYTQCYTEVYDGDQGQLVGVEPGGSNDYSYSQTVCYTSTVWYDDGAGYQGGGGTSGGGTTSGGGGGGPYTDPYSDPCPPVMVARVPPESDPCGGSLGWEPIVSPRPTPMITVDPSITDFSKVKCVYDHLMADNLQNGLKQILAAFDNNQTYNVTFKVEDIDAPGRTNYLGNNNFLIRIDATDAYDAGYSRIWLASTFIHEAFHAKLRQKSLEVLGTDVIQNWPKKIDDMTLSELATYFQQSSESQNTWNNIGHDWMVNHVDEMAISIREFVKTYYHATYGQVGENLDAYRALAYMGLSGSKFYQEKVVNSGIQVQLNSYRASLSEGGVCSN